LAWGAGITFFALACAQGCAGSSSTNATGAADGGADSAGSVDGGPNGDGSSAAQCPPCVSDKDCNGAICAQFGGDAFCAPACPNGNECAADRACTQVTSATGVATKVCVPRSDVCGTATPDGGGGGQDASVPFDGGGNVTGTVGPTGGTLSRLFFAVVGDTRPATDNDTAGYPTPIITKIFSGIAAANPKPAFIVSTGDYMFAYPTANQGAAQLDLYLAARAKYTGTEFYALGNHECTGQVTSNCGAGNADGTPNNYTAFMSKMLGSIGKTEPYYSFEVNAIDNSWTAKFVVIAANAWTTAQGTWLSGVMAKPTTYTFVVRHEPRNANTAPGVTPSEGIINSFPYTLAIVGHSHAYFKSGPKQVTIGNGGAPLMSGSYGYGVVAQRADKAITVDMIDYQTGLADSAFHFALKPDGSYTQ
jgi:hypothetical protein